MSLLGLVFVWAIIKVMHIMNVSNKQVVRFETNVQTNTVLVQDNYDEFHQNDKSFVTNKLKDQILELYESDLTKSGKNVDRMVELLSMFRKHNDTTELLDTNPYLLDYIFGNSV